MDEENNNNLWYRKIGFYNNPLSIKPAPYDFKVVGQDDIIEELTYKIPAGTITFVEGALGTGKSTIMKYLIHKFKGKGQVIFFSCNRIDNELNVEEMLVNKYGFWGRLMKKHPKDMILLLDEAQELTPENTERIKYFFDAGNIKSVVFTGTDYSKVNLHESIKERIGQDGVLKVKELSEDDAVNLVRNRLGNLNLLNDDMIKKLYKFVGKNPRRLLQRCDKACRHVIENGEREFTDTHFKHLFGEMKEEKKVMKKEIKKKNSPKSPMKKNSQKGNMENEEDLYETEEV